MDHRSKRVKPNDYHESQNNSENENLIERSRIPRSSSPRLAEHSGEGVQNVNGRFHNGRDFNSTNGIPPNKLSTKLTAIDLVSHYHDSTIHIHSHPASQSPFDPDIIKEQKRRDLLESLRFTQIDARQASIKKAHTKTCKWFPKSPEYLDWLNPNKFDSHGGLLWVKGKPGAGKSTLMKFAYSQACRTMPQKGKTVISFFFNARGSELEKSTIGLYRSLLVQLFEARPRIQHVLDSITPKPQWSIDSLESLFEGALEALEGDSLVCFIDALDECNEQQIRDMLSFLQRASKEAVLSDIELIKDSN
ncbi:hypothetical protein M426DRAFT_14086 [Hypoxylon sp. CI-4A]|nr:hypothetical protein M426DRAFT_14086 [Hypoxylon sp. CI-4A]